MRRANLIAFDDYVSDATPQYSTTELNKTLGEFDSWALQVVVDDPKNATSITVQLETSADGRNWLPKNDQPEVSGILGAGTSTVLQGRDPGTIGPGLTLVRLKVTMFAAGSVPSAHLKIWVRGGDRAGDFIPRHLPGCVLWLRSDLGVVTAAGTNISTWTDQSGSGNTASTGPTSPTYNTSGGVLGLPRVTTAAGSSEYMLGNFATNVTAHTLFAVLGYASPLDNYASFAGTDATSAVNSGFAQFSETPTGIVGRAGSGGAFASANTSDTSSIGAPGIYSTAADSNASVDLFVNGVSKATAATTFALTSCPKYILFGLGLPLQYNFIGDAYEFVLFNRVLGATERALVHRYLGVRYGIAVP